MIKLYGFPMSNYFSMVKAGLLEKGLQFEVVPTRPSQDSEYLAKSPMGKVPCIATEQGCLSETHTILEYLEELKPDPALLPRGAFERAKVRELIHGLELYIELPARTCYAPVFFGGSASDETQQKARETLTKGVHALRQLAAFKPYIAGSELSFADLFAMYTIPIAGRVTKQLWSWDIIAELPGAADWQKLMSERKSIQAIRADQRSAAAAG